MDIVAKLKSFFSWQVHGDGKHVGIGKAVSPDERLSYPRTIGIGAQHVLAMMGATLLVPALTGMPAATTLFFSAIGTALFLTITGNKVPSYLGSSFAFLAPLAAAGVYASPEYTPSVEAIRNGLGGILLAGVLLAVVGAVVHYVGASWIQKIMPAAVTGSIVALIGLNLADEARFQWDQSPWTALVTITAVLLAMVVFKGFLGRIAILVGAVVGSLFAAWRGEWDGAGDVIGKADWFGLPEYHTPTFEGSVLVAFIPVVLVLIAENIGHVKSVSAMTGKDLDPVTGRALFADGVATTIAGLGGGSGTTTYAENIGVMAATKIYSTAVFLVAGCMAVLLGFSPKFGALIQAIPLPVMGGVSIVVFGLIAIAGAKIWVDNKVDFSDNKNLLVAAITLVLGTGDYTLRFGEFALGGIGTATFGAIGLWALLGRRKG